MTSSVTYTIYLGVILFSFVVGILRSALLRDGAKMIVILLGCTLVSEYMADVLTRKYHNNMVVYHIYGPLHLFLVSLYFNESIQSFKKRHIGWYIGIAGVIVGIINTFFLQPIAVFNSYYLLFAGFLIISMSLYAFYKILENDDVGTLNNPHFWISLLLLFFWSVTYFHWSAYAILSKAMTEYLSLVPFVMPFISSITYLGFGLVFLLYPKTQKIER